MASLFLLVGAVWAQAPVATPEEAITELLNRIGGNGAADKFEIVIDGNLAENGKDVFVITSQNGKPCIKGNTQLSVATGINWYLNHYAHINLTWNNLTTDLVSATLPVPGSEEKHVCNTTYRYNFNTCTFSYSMAFWTWERWQQEIDWMALHGINAPLNLVGLDVVTRKFLRELGVSENDINAYIAGPGFIAWFAMNNLEGWGGTINSLSTGVDMSGNPDWWYTRQENLCRNMLQRMRELGMQPVIPGFSGQIPNSLSNYSISGFSSSDVINGGTWAGGYTRPDILKPSTNSYKNLASVYYKHLEDVMGVSEFYSMDPFHEGNSLPSGITADNTWPKIMAELDNYYVNVSKENLTKYSAPEKPKWIIQKWQALPPGDVFSTMSGYPEYKERFIGLDLFADNIYAGNAAFWKGQFYAGCPYVYCMLHNFGGRSGMHGRLETTMDGYFQALAKGNNCQGIGATPEGIETNPILYDMLFELPWMDPAKRPTADEWLADYSHARYGVDNKTAPKALSALKNLKKSVWDCKVNQQGTSEAVILARPNWTVGSVSSWSTSAIYWDTQDVLQAADELSAIKDVVTANGGEDGIANYNYDFIDVVRQAMVDYAAELLPLIKAAHEKGDNTEYTRLYQLYLQLMLDLDAMLSYDENFKLERWTSLARNIADEVDDTDENDRNWLEWNARTQVTVWSKGNTDLHDYSNRCWSGLIKDFHYKRWKHFFENNGNAPSGGWYSGFEYPWTVDFNNTYNLAGDYSQVVIPNDMTATEKAVETFGKYFGRVKGATKNYIFPMGVARKATASDVIPEVYRGKTVELPLIIGKNVTITSVWVDLNNDGAKGNGETLTAANNEVDIPADAKIGKTTAQVVYSDGTDITFSIALVEDITEARTVTAVAGANGSVAIEGTNALSVTNTDAVKMTATANTGYNFENWTKGGEVVSNDNPFIYYGKEDATFTANFIQDKWGVVECAPDKDGAGNVKDEADVMNDISNNKQYIPELKLTYYNREAETIFEATSAPTSIFTTIPQIINVPQGASFDIEYNNGGNDGFKHCYFRAYIDLNVDGDFDDEGELLKEVGTRGAQNTAVCSNKINVLLPYDMPLGITHMRLRFDSAWNIGDNAKSQSVRPVYELIINVTDKSDKAATVNVETNNADWGTVEVWTDETPDGSTGTSWNVSANIPLYLRATKTSEDVEFLGWYDHYGRLLTENLEHTMYAREDATYTAKFRKALDIDDGWVFEYRTETGVVILTRVRQSGDHDLVIPETVEILGEQCKIVGFDNGVFNNNKDLWSISLPQTIEFLSEKSLFNHTLTGNGGTQTFDVNIKNNEGWTITMDVKRTGELTGWGSCLIASGSNPAKPDGSNYAEGFQFYLQSPNNPNNKKENDKLIIKTKTQVNDNWYFDDIYQEASFKVIITYNGAQQLSVNVLKADGTNATNHNGKQEPIVFTDCTIQDIKQLCTNVQATITANVKIDKTAESDPFLGCSNLLDITVANGCTSYRVADRKLYNASDYVLHTLADANKADAIRNLGTLIDNTKALMDAVATSIDPVGKATEITLSTTEDAKNNYILCNAPSANEGVGNLLDNNDGTILHTAWNAGAVSAYQHYLLIELAGGEDLSNFKFRYKARTGNANSMNMGDIPSGIKVYGSMKEDGVYDELSTISGLTQSSGYDWTSPAITGSPSYRYLRFNVTANNGYWHMAEFDLFKLTSVVEVAEEYKELAGITNDEAANVYDNLVNALYVYNNGGTAEEMQAAYDVLEPLYTELNDKKNKFEYVREINELVPATEELINAIATSDSRVAELDLTTTVDADFYVSTNADQNTGGGNKDGNGIAGLVDGTVDTYFHSRWGGTAAVNAPHHIKVDLGQGNEMSVFQFSYVAHNAPDPTEFVVSGSNDGKNFNRIDAITKNVIDVGATYTSKVFVASESYRYLLFEVTNSSRGGFNASFGDYKCFGMKEYYLYKSNVEVAPAYNNLGGITNEVATAAYDNMVKAQALCTTGTATELEAALDALRTSYETLNAKKGKVLNGVYHINYDGGDLFVAYAEANTLTGLTGNGYAGFRLFDAQVDNSGTGNNSGDTDDNLKALQNNAIAAKVAADELFTIVPNNEGTGYLISAQGLYMEPVGKTSEWCIQAFDTNVANAGIYLIEEASDGAFNLKCANPQEKWKYTNYVHDWGPVFGCDRYEKPNLSTFKFNPVTEYTLTVPASGYAAVCLPFNVVLPEGVEAYDINSLEKQKLVSGEVLAKIAGAGDIVMAGTPMVVKTTAGDHTLGITMESEGAKTSLEGSVLRGNFVKQNLAVSAEHKTFVLEGDVWTLLEIGSEMPANTCWMEVAELDYDYNIDMSPELVEIGGWKFRYEYTTNGVKLTDAAVYGNGELVIPAQVTFGEESRNVDAISPDFLHGNTTLTSIKFPATLTNLGFRVVEPMFGDDTTVYEGEEGDGGKYEGNKEISQVGAHRCFKFPIDPSSATGDRFKVDSKSAWRLTLDVTIDDPKLNFNNYGSAIVSTNENSLADNYSNGDMQIYMKAGHDSIIVKIDNADDRYTYTLPVLDNEGKETGELVAHSHFVFELEHDGTGGYQVVIYYDDGRKKMYSISADEGAIVKDFSKLYYSLPKGIRVKVKVDKLISQGLFVGCTNLQKIEVDENNPTFMACDHGVLYDKNQYYVMRIPEGDPGDLVNGRKHFEIPSKVVKLYAGSFHGVDADIVLHSNPIIGVVEGHKDAVKNAKFFLSLDDIDGTIAVGETGHGGARDFISTNNNEYQSARYKRTPLGEDKYGTICLPFVPENALGKYDFFEFKYGEVNSFVFSQVASVNDLKANTPYLYKLKDEDKRGGMESENGLDVFETSKPFTVDTHAKYNPADEVAGTSRALGTYVNFNIETKNYKDKSAYYYFSTGQQKFLKVTEQLNYRPYRAIFVVNPKDGNTSQAPARISLRLLDGTTTDIDASLVEGMETPVYYDLSGRRVLNPGSGVYIVNGKKVFIK